MYDNEYGGDQANLGNYEVDEDEQIQSLPVVTSEYNVGLNDESEHPVEKPKKAKKFKGWFSWHGFKKKSKLPTSKREKSQYIYAEEDAIEYSLVGDEAVSKKSDLLYETENSYSLKTVAEYTLQPKVSEESIVKFPYEITVEHPPDTILPAKTKNEEEQVKKESEASTDSQQRAAENENEDKSESSKEISLQTSPLTSVSAGSIDSFPPFEAVLQKNEKQESANTFLVEAAVENSHLQESSADKEEWSKRNEEKLNNSQADVTYECEKENYNSLTSTDSGVEPPECFEIHLGQIEETIPEFEKYPFGFESVSCRSLTLQTPASPQSAYMVTNDNTYFESAHIGASTEIGENSVEPLVADAPAQRFASQFHTKLLNNLSSTGTSTLQTLSSPLFAVADCLTKVSPYFTYGVAENGNLTRSCSSVSVKSLGSLSTETIEKRSTGSLVSVSAQQSEFDNQTKSVSSNVSNFDPVQAKMATAIFESCVTSETTIGVSKSCATIVSANRQNVSVV